MVRYWLIDGKTMRNIIKGVGEDVVNTGLTAVRLLMGPALSRVTSKRKVKFSFWALR